MATKKYTCVSTNKLVEMLEDILPNHYIKYFKLVIADGTVIEMRNDESPNETAQTAEEL